MPDLTHTLSEAEAAATVRGAGPVILSRRLYDQITARVVDLERLEALALADREAVAAWEAQNATRQPGTWPEDRDWRDRYYALLQAQHDTRVALHAALVGFAARPPAAETETPG
jgi:alpha-D-ribose 1-methylphosphonate 5-triphosphate synthase subunit PhnI